MLFARLCQEIHVAIAHLARGRTDGAPGRDAPGRRSGALRGAGPGAFFNSLLVGVSSTITLMKPLVRVRNMMKPLMRER